MTGYGPRWCYQYQRIADVLTQRVGQLRPSEHAALRSAMDREYVRKLVAAAPPLTEMRRAKIAMLLHGAIARS